MNKTTSEQIKERLTPGVYWDSQYNNKVTIFEDPKTGDLLKCFYDKEGVTYIRPVLAVETALFIQTIESYKEEKTRLFKTKGRILYNATQNRLVITEGGFKTDEDNKERFLAMTLDKKVKASSSIWFILDVFSWVDVTENFLAYDEGKK